MIAYLQAAWFKTPIAALSPQGRAKRRPSSPAWLYVAIASLIPKCSSSSMLWVRQ